MPSLGGMASQLQRPNLSNSLRDDAFNWNWTEDRALKETGQLSDTVETYKRNNSCYCRVDEKIDSRYDYAERGPVLSRRPFMRHLSG